MDSNYTSISYTILPRTTLLRKPDHMLLTDVSLDDQATVVMTDLKHVVPHSIDAIATLGMANEKMIACGVRLLFVADIKGVVQGLITATDILGDKPVRYISEHGGDRDSILVQDVMTQNEHLEALAFRDVCRASVGDIVETIKLFGRQHLLVTEVNEKSGDANIRGLFSATQISRQLGQEIIINTNANTFAARQQAILQ